jgi:predicted Fe-Mo cluster-binding NifX family protein
MKMAGVVVSMRKRRFPRQEKCYFTRRDLVLVEKLALEPHINDLRRGALECYVAGAVVQPATCRLGAKQAGSRLQHQWKSLIQLPSISTESAFETFQNRVRWSDTPERLKWYSTRCSNRSTDAAGQSITMNKPWTAEQQIQGFKLLEKILDRRDARPISKKLLAKIIASSDDGPDLLEVVLRHNTHTIDEHFLKIAVVKGSEAVRLLLSYYTNLIISEDIMLEAVQKFDSAVVKVLLTQEKHVDVTERVVKAAASRRQPNIETVKLLLKRSGELATMEEILGLAAERDFQDAPITRMLLNHQEMLVTEHLLEGALRN